MAKSSAGILVFRRQKSENEVLLAHPGGPYWQKKDIGAWSIPKGEIGPEEVALHAACREFLEETGLPVPSGPFIELSPVKQKSGKVVYAWAVEGVLDLGSFKSNTFEMEWPPKSGMTQLFPEIDQLHWFALDEARRKLNGAQSSFIEQLERHLSPPEAYPRD